MKPLTAQQRQDVRQWRGMITGLDRLPDEYLYSLQRRYMDYQTGDPDARPWARSPNPLLFAEKLLEWGVFRTSTQTWCVLPIWTGSEYYRRLFNPSLEAQ